MDAVTDERGQSSPFGAHGVAPGSVIGNVPTATSTTNFGLPTKQQATSTPFVRPRLEPIGPVSTAMVVGRCLMVVGAVLVALAARRTADRAGSSDEFWAVTAAAGVFVVVGLMAQVVWIAALADSAHRLRVRGVSARGQVIVWSLVVIWIAIACLTYLRVEVDDDLNPLPALAIAGGALTLVVAYARMRTVFGGLSRTPPPVVLTVFPLDLAVLVVMWWRLIDLSTARDDLRSTATLAFAAAGVLVVNAVVFAWLAKRGAGAIDERLRRLESQHRQASEGGAPSADWLLRRTPSAESDAGSAPPIA